MSSPRRRESNEEKRKKKCRKKRKRKKSWRNPWSARTSPSKNQPCKPSPSNPSKRRKTKTTIAQRRRTTTTIGNRFAPSVSSFYRVRSPLTKHRPFFLFVSISISIPTPFTHPFQSDSNKHTQARPLIAYANLSSSSVSDTAIPTWL